MHVQQLTETGSEGERESFRYAYCEVSTAAQGLLANVLHFTKALYAYEMHFFPPKKPFLFMGKSFQNPTVSGSSNATA